MQNLVVGMHHPIQFTVHCLEEIGTTIQHGISQQVHNIGRGCHEALGYVGTKCMRTIDKTELFLYENRGTLFFIGCSAVTAIYSPLLFFPAAIAGAGIRFEGARKLKELADKYLNKELNPYQLHSRYDKCVTSLAIAAASVAAFDALALGTFYSTSYMAIAFLPVLGGLAAGDAVAKWAMNYTGFLDPAPPAALNHNLPQNEENGLENHAAVNDGVQNARNGLRIQAPVNDRTQQAKNEAENGARKNGAKNDGVQNGANRLGNQGAKNDGVPQKENERINEYEIDG